MREPVAAPSGRIYQWEHPPRRVHWKHGRAGRTFAAKMESIVADSTEGDPLSDEERAMRLFESMGEDDLTRLEAYADDVLKAGLGHLPADMPDVDYWFFFGRSVYGVKEMKVETTEGETTVEAVETFRKKLGLPSDGEDVPDVRAAAIRSDGDTSPLVG